MSFDMSDAAKYAGIFVMFFAFVLTVISGLTFGFSLGIYWIPVFIMGLLLFVSGFTIFRKNSNWRRKYGIQ